MHRRAFVTAAFAALAASQASAQTQTAAATPFIEPQNELERALVAATERSATDVQRNAFRRLFLRSNVALALSANAPEAPPALIQLPTGVQTCLIFTSSARATEIMGESTPRIVLTGRQALERVRGANVVININRRPYLTLDAAGVDGFLSLPDGRPSPAPPEAPAPHSTGPSQ